MSVCCRFESKLNKITPWFTKFEKFVFMMKMMIMIMTVFLSWKKKNWMRLCLRKIDIGETVKQKIIEKGERTTRTKKKKKKKKVVQKGIMRQTV